MFNVITARSSHLRQGNIVGQYGRRRHHRCNECAAHILCASRAQQRSQHSAPAEFGEAGGAAEDCRPKAAKHVPTCGLRAGAEPGAPSEARLPTFARQARAPARCGSGERGKAWRSWLSGGATISATQRWVASLLRRPLKRNDSIILSSRPEMTPKPCTSRVCEAKGNGGEGFRAARKGGEFRSFPCYALCTLENRTKTQGRTE